MASAVRNLRWILTGEDKSASSSLEKVGKTADTTHRKFALLGAGLAGGAIGAGIASFGKKAVEAAIEGEGAHARLAQAIKNTGGSLEDLEPKVDKLSGRFAKLGFSNDEVETALGSMTTATGSAEKAMSLMNSAADVARYKHISLADAGTLLAKAQGGSMRAFKELGIQVETGVPKAQALRDAMAQLNQRIGGQAAAQAGTYSGKIQALHAQWGNFQEQVGTKLLPVLVKLMSGLSSVAGFVERNQAVIKPLAVILGTLAGTIFAVSKAIKVWAAVQKILDLELAANPIGAIILLIAALAAGLIYAYKHSETFRNIVNGAFKAIGDAAKAMWGIIRPVLKAWADMWLTVVGLLVDGAAKAFGWVPGIGGKLKSAAKEFDKFKDKVNNSLDGITPTKTITITALTTSQAAAGMAAIQAEQANQGVAQRQHRGTTVIVHHTTNVDGKTVARSTTKHQTKATQRGALMPGLT